MKSGSSGVGSSNGRSPDEQISNALTPLIHILDSFNHRNKNQHHVAHWWSQFDILRRAVRRLHDALAARFRNAQAQSFKIQKQKPSKTRRALDEDIAIRVKILIEKTVPVSFLTFTQLIADNQHATLGLVLLGVLASINSALAPLAIDRSGRTSNVLSSSTSLNNPPTTTSMETVKEDCRSVDLGVAVSRDQLRLVKRAEPQPELHGQDSAKPKKRKTTTIAEDLPPIKTSKDKKSVTKAKKRSKKGDDFSDLFSSIM